ncbi:AraC family transcriptional regulator [Cellulophaga geojensis KL-A]|uniref:AraC family transcriptional regulator n=1 Tax=Cellulophaga geojensis KL-A TaxID=1328323 RepID=A0ABN0RPM5_9FLAO|nr:helix-turn-helix transcriptional regulator [Cellulophaga geojensis]EWH13790.1 AraC family transcriptional regulator [Cellulophaga geojensis KL-A]
MKVTTIEDFYKEINAKLPEEIGKYIGHFNIFNIPDMLANLKKDNVMPYNRRMYYKISLINGKNKAEYADKIINIDKYALLFGSPKIPYRYEPLDAKQKGKFCVFTDEFLIKSKSGVVLDDLPIFNSGGCPVFKLTKKEYQELAVLFKKMQAEIDSSYAYKYDLIRNYILEIIHFGQKLQPSTALYTAQTASKRITSLFLELLERQFPIESTQQQLKLRSAKDYANRLAVHVNHLNTTLKEVTGNTTTYFIANRITQEAKYLLKQTNWSVSEIAYSLGFDEVAHFSNFFKKQTSFSPNKFRN